MKQPGRSTLTAVGLMATFTIVASGQSTGSRNAARPSEGEPAVAIVSGMKLTRSTFEQRVRGAEEEFRGRSNVPLPAEYRPMMRRQVLEAMIREQLLILEARRRGMGLTDAEAEEEIKKEPFFQTRGMFDEAKYLAVKATQPQVFRNALDQIKSTLPARRLKEQIERQNGPDEQKLRAEVGRKLSQVTLDFLALRRASFKVDLPEPSEREVLDYHRAHASEFRRPEQARLTVAFVNRPELPPSERSSSTALQAWEARMRQRADSLIGALRRGARLEDLAPSFGDVTSVTVSRDDFPGYWRGGPRARQAIFSAAPGSVLDEAIPGEPGFLVARVDERLPARTALLREVVGTIRGRLRAEQAARRDEHELRSIYEALKDSLRGAAYRLRYAVADTGLRRVPEPTAAELDRFYRGHLADYSFFDPKTSSVGARPLAEVRAELRARLLQERRLADARSAAERLYEVWGSGRRDAKLERAMASMREIGPIPAGGVVDSGLAGAALTEALAARRGLHTGLARFSRGWIVYEVFAEIMDYTPTLEQSRTLLAGRREPARLAEEEAGARRLFEQDPGRFKAGHVVRFSRLMVQPPGVADVQLSREEVERHYNANLEDYGAPELLRARHILVSPRDAGPQADAEARRKVEDLLRRLQAGERFAELARQYSDDEATRDNGGDLGVFRHGMMLDEFERAAFTMQPGDLRGPIRTEVGYHVIECLEHVPAEVTPLKYCYANVAAAAARSKAQRIARFRADSLRRALKSPVQAAALARRHGMVMFQNEHVVGSPVHVADLKDYFATLETLKPGVLAPGMQEYRGVGFAITWVDSILPPRMQRWEEVREQAMDLYRREADRRMMLAKKAELDSLMAAGWSFDSLSAQFGGFERHGPAGPGSGLERLAGRELLDSLAFGTPGSPPALQLGRPTGWIEFPAGLAMMRLVERKEPDPVQLANRMESERRAALERNLRVAYDRMKQRFPVEILDPDLKIVELPPVTDS